MKAKKCASLILAAAMTVGGASLLAACGKGGNKDKFTVDETVYYAVGQSNGEDGSLYQQGGSATGWPPAVADDDLKFVRDTTITDENVFTLSLKMYEGDAFKILHDFEGDWDTVQINMCNFGDQMEGEDDNRVVKYNNEICFVTSGSGNVGSNIICAEGADGNYTFTLKTFPGTEKEPVLSVVKNSSIPRLTKMYVNGDINDFGYAQNKSDFNMTNTNGVWSLIVDVKAENLTRDAEGKLVEEGAAYTAVQVKNLGGEPNEQKIFTATPADGDKFKEATDETEGKINLLPEGKWSILYNQAEKKVTISEMAYEMYFIGDFNTWKQADEDYALTVNATGTVWSGTIEITEEILGTKDKIGMKLFNAKGKTDADKYVPGGLDNIELGLGEYFFTYDVNTNEVKYEKCEYWVVGTFVDEENNKADFAIKNGVTLKLTAGETAGVYTGTLTVKDVTGVDGYAWLSSNKDAEEKPAIFAIQVVYGTELAGKDAQKWVGGGNTYIGTAGTYTVTFTLGEKNVTTVTPAN